MKLADALVTTLRDWDLEYVFGVGGANIEHFYDAAHRLGDGKFRVIAAKSEIGAAFMADCRARTHRTLGVCCATSGGGMMNLAVGVAESFAESIPVLAIVGQPPTALQGRGAFQDSSGIGRSVNADRLWSAITKHHVNITDPLQFWEMLEASVRACLSGRPGPAVLMIPRDMFDREVGAPPPRFPKSLRELMTHDMESSAAVDDLFDTIRAAQCPVLLLGGGVLRCSDLNAIGEFARRNKIYVATTLSSKGAFPNDDPLYLGMAGVAGEPSVHQFLNEVADLVVCVGTDLGAMTTQPIKTALSPEKLAVVNVDVSEAHRIVTPKLSLQMDEGVAFSLLNKRCDDLLSQPTMPAPVPSLRYAARKAPELAPTDFDDDLESDRDGLRQSEALQVLQQFLPEEGHLVFDAGNCAAAALHYLSLPRDVTSTIALGMGGMGYAIAGAIGAQLGSRPGTRTMVLCGDGAFLMLGTEVHTAVHYRLPILFVVFNNNMHGMCVTRQQLYFQGRVEGARYPQVSISDMARGLGVSDRLWVASASTAEQVADALNDFELRSSGPGVLELRLQCEEIPPFAPFLPADAPTFVVPRLSSDETWCESADSGEKCASGLV